MALAAGRVALVVGNSTYSHIARLPNPENDAADMAAALQRLGFEVTTAQDADRASLNEALRVFTRQSVGADMALVFYAGHGLEMDGVNYLVPVDARLDVLAATAGASLTDGDHWTPAGTTRRSATSGFCSSASGEEVQVQPRRDPPEARVRPPQVANGADSARVWALGEPEDPDAGRRLL